MPSADATQPSYVQPREPSIKRRAACDECRTKKLKCSGEHPACARCVRESIACVYSVQKQMGRPKKRQRTDEDGVDLPRIFNAPDNRQDGWGAEIGDEGGASTVAGGASSSMVEIDVQGQFGQAGQLSSYDGAESLFTPGGDLQPWLVEQTQAWAEEALRDSSTQIEGAGGVPALTPDSSSSSPPLHNLPPELLPDFTAGIDHGNGGDRDTSTSLLLDPVLAHPNIGCSSMNALPSCACLSTMYLTLNSLQSMDESFTFPFALHPLREAMRTTYDLVDCEECPKRFITGMQNTQLIGTVLMCIAERLGKVLESISIEAARAERAGETKKFRLADLNTSTSHLHAGGLGCIAAFNLDLSPSEWRTMCKKVVRAEVHGPADGNDCCPYFMSLVKRMEDRQDRWHKRPPPEDFPKDQNGVLVGGPRNPSNHPVNQEVPLCLRLINFAKTLIAKVDWT